MRAAAARPLLVVLTALLALGVAVACFTTWGVSAPPSGHGEVAVDEAAAPGSVVSSPLATPVQRILAADAARLEGVAFDALGKPLANWWVCLGDADRPVRRQLPTAGDALSAYTDAKGRFEFAELRPGRYQLVLYGDPGDEQEVDLAAGERRSVQIALQGCRLQLVFVRRGEPTALSAEVIASDGTRVRTWPEGAVTGNCVVASGTHRVHVVDARGSAVCGERRVFVAVGQAFAAATIDVSSPWLEAIVDDRSTLPIPALSFEVKGTKLAGGQATYYLGSADGRSAAGEVPAGSWTVTVRSPRLLGVPPQSIDLAEGQLQARVVFAAERSGFVRLTLRTLDGQPFPAYPSDPMFALMPAQSDRGGETPCVELARWVGRDVPTPGLVNVPGGLTTFRWIDRVVDGEAVYLPFEPPPPHTLEVLIDGENPLELRVEPRALVDLVACEPNGIENPRARIGVFAGAQRVRPMPAGAPSHWKSYLPPGEYRVVVEYPDATREHRIQVARSALQMRLRP